MHIDSLFIYPVKSMRGYQVSELELASRGPVGDRRWVVIDANTHRCITQRDTTRLATITAIMTDKGLTLSAPTAELIGVAYPSDQMAYNDIRIWKDKHCLGFDAGDDIARWLSHYLERNVRLAWQPDHAMRATSENYSQPGDHVSYADGYPLSITTTASLAALQAHMKEVIPMDRFRPNIVLGRTAPFEEDILKQIQIRNVVLDVVKPAPRCVMTTLDQQTGEQTCSKEPLHTLKALRLGKRGIFFSQNAIARTHDVIRSQQTVEVIKWRDQPSERLDGVKLGYDL